MATRDRVAWHRDLCSGEGRDHVVPASQRAPGTIRRWFAEGGFRHQAFIRVPDSSGTVGVERFVGALEPFRTGLRLFEFIDA